MAVARIDLCKNGELSLAECSKERNLRNQLRKTIDHLMGKAGDYHHYIQTDYQEDLTEIRNSRREAERSRGTSRSQMILRKWL